MNDAVPGTHSARKPLLALRMRRSFSPIVFALAIVLLRAVPAEAQISGAQLCQSAYSERSEVDLATVLAGRGRVSDAWGHINMQRVADVGENEASILRVRFPRGSVNPGNTTAPSGGAGFLMPLERHAIAACLIYQVRFPKDFLFAKGGKLPGLYGGTAPRGCGSSSESAGFSARLMWRAAGAGELYLYAPHQSTVCGQSIARGAWTFATGRWTEVTEQVVMNAPEKSDGLVRIWIDGQLKVEAENLVLRNTDDVSLMGLLFSTFFGGRDSSWASPTDQYLDFRDIHLLY